MVNSRSQNSWRHTVPRRRRGAAARLAAAALLILGVAACGSDGTASSAAGAGNQEPPAATAVSDGEKKKNPSTKDKPEATKTAKTSDKSKPDKTTGKQTTAPVKKPTAEITAADLLKRNPLYQAAALRSAGCNGASDVPLDSEGNVRKYYESVLPCLESAWKQVGKDTDIDVRPVNLEVFAGPSTSSCLPGAEYSFYCPSDETIYMYADEMIQPWLDFPTEESHGLTRLAATHTIAHEYGHHIQWFTNISAAAGPDVSGTELERRLELQASCLANVFLASQADAYPIADAYVGIPELWRYITRVPNHGSEANQAVWTERGYKSAEPGDCNTFTAAEKDVA